jgi:glycine dehydrogenase subunit 2
MKNDLATKGIVLNEPLLWEKGQPGRIGFSIPRGDVPRHEINADLKRDDLDFPDLSEVDLVRHYTRLSTWNFGVDTGMYPLGSCTMKYNPKTNERQAAIPAFSQAHPLLPADLSQGALELMYRLERFLCAITGMEAASLQPGAGAQGELTGMLLIHAYHQKQNDQRTKIIIPDTAHGTNPASAALCGYTPLPVKSNAEGVLSAKAVAALMDTDTAGIMVTNPNTLGLFEKNIHKIADIVHAKGGLVYGDGANLNAVMGMLDMQKSGLDVIHLNLHKTFTTPHGGGGPGAGPVCVNAKLAPFLPTPRVVPEPDGFRLENEFPDSIGRLLSFNGHFNVLIRAYSYILSMGADGLKKASQLAVLNANYIKEKLKDVFHLPYDRSCMHECVFSDQNQVACGISTLDIAKRLMDYGFHPPTIYFPLVVPGAIMVEPTETESKDDLDAFIEAMRAIDDEAKKNPEMLRNAPHNTKVRRLDEVSAARKPCLTG